jgi:glutamyl endopeptidase
MDCVLRRRAARENSRPLGARAASYLRHATDGIGAAPTNGQLAGQSTIPTLVPIPDTTIMPYRQICLLEIIPATGQTLQGTGWLAGPRTVITAGHCVYQTQFGSWATTIRVHLAVNGTNQEYYPVQESHSLHSVEQWTNGGDPAYDYGAVILPSAVDAGNFGYKALADSDLQSLLVSLVGYPVTSPDHETMWGDQGFLIGVKPTQIFYDIESEEGMSGCPVFYTDGEKRYAVGIHNYGGGSSGNYATRISEPVYNDINAWATGS